MLCQSPASARTAATLLVHGPELELGVKVSSGGSSMKEASGGAFLLALRCSHARSPIGWLRLT